MIHRAGLLLVGLVTLAVPAPAAAGLIMYTDAASFQTGTVGANSNIDFAGMVPSHQFISYPAPGGLSVDGVTFNIANPVAGSALNVTANNYYPGVTYAQNFLVDAYVPAAPLLTVTITLPKPVTAVGIDLGTFNGSSLGFSFSNGESIARSGGIAAFGQTSFLGFTSSTPFTSVSISEASGGGEALVIDDVQFGKATPEPASIALLASGLLVVGCRLALGRRNAEVAVSSVA